MIAWNQLLELVPGLNKHTISFCHDGQTNHQFDIFTFSCEEDIKWFFDVYDWIGKSRNSLCTCLPFFLSFFDTCTHKRRANQRIKFQVFSSRACLFSLLLLMRSIIRCIYVFVRCNKQSKKKEEKHKANIKELADERERKNTHACGFHIASRKWE